MSINPPELAYLNDITPENPMAYWDRAKIAADHGVVLNVYVPYAESWTGRRIAPGSAVVGLPTGDTSVLIYFEGAVYHEMTFDEKLLHAADRMVTRYPTVAMMLSNEFELTPVGTYDVATNTLTVTNAKLLDEWLGGKRAELT